MEAVNLGAALRGPVSALEAALALLAERPDVVAIPLGLLPGDHDLAQVPLAAQSRPAVIGGTVLDIMPRPSTGAPAGSTDGEGWTGMFHPDDQERAWAVWSLSLATGEPYASVDPEAREGDLRPLFETIVDQVPMPPVNLEGPFQLQVSSLDYSSYVGVIGIGRIARGRIQRNTPVTVVSRDGGLRRGRILQILGFLGLERVEVPDAHAGDIIAFTGIEELYISDTLCDPNAELACLDQRARRGFEAGELRLDGVEFRGQPGLGGQFHDRARLPDRTRA